MSIVRRARTMFERASGLHVYRGLPHGTNVASDIRRTFQGHVTKNVFDIGANVGQSAVKFRAYFPTAKILCFEPVSGTFAQLVKATQSLGNVECLNIGLGDTAGTQAMVVTGQAVTFHLLRDGESADAGTTETVEIQRIDDFCAANDIDAVSYMKIDAEGFDLRVLCGAEGLIRAGAVDFIQVEAGMNRGFGVHVSFNDLFSWLTERGYELFGIYDQCRTWPRGQILRRADAVFVSKRLVSVR